tara:strand:- start:219 stop:458 length:240 start_codon:yes stop_codon:yes gene_type:complete
MIKNFKFTLTSIVSIIILLALAFVFMTGFIAILGIFFLTRLYKKFKPKSSKNDEFTTSSKTNTSKDKVVDVDSDEYKID